MNVRPIPIAFALLAAAELGIADFRVLQTHEPLKSGDLAALIGISSENEGQTTNFAGDFRRFEWELFAQFLNFPNFPNFPNFANFTNCFNGMWRNC